MANETQIDLNRFIENQQGKLEFKSETSEEKASRLHKEEADALFKRWRDMIQHLLTMVGAAIIVGFGLFFLASKTADPEAKKWASTTLTALAAGIGGYLYGKSTAKE